MIIRREWIGQVQQHSQSRSQKEASSKYLQTQAKTPAPAAFTSLMACFKKQCITNRVDGTKATTVQGEKKLPETSHSENSYSKYEEVCNLNKPI